LTPNCAASNTDRILVYVGNMVILVQAVVLYMLGRRVGLSLPQTRCLLGFARHRRVKEVYGLRNTPLKFVKTPSSWRLSFCALATLPSLPAKIDSDDT
jgi:hypothetical protein